jgi:hypothetical protein
VMRSLGVCLWKGCTVRGGFEKPLGSIISYLPGRWTFKVEYMHTQFDNVVRDFSYPGFPKAFRHDVTNSSSDQIRFGLNYLFY